MGTGEHALPSTEELHFCAYCHGVLPQEPEEIRQVFEHTGVQPVIWMVYRCNNRACQRRTFLVYTPAHASQKKK